MNAADPAKEPKLTKTGLATLGGGCFWCVEAAFETFKGVKAVTSGYAGGQASNPSYEQVCTGKTGHAEVVQVEFDPTQISYEQLLEIFGKLTIPPRFIVRARMSEHRDRSIILYHDESQKRIAEKSKEAAQKKLPDPIVTEIVALTKFYLVEEHHQDYFQKHPNAPYCAVVISPKLKKLQKVKHLLERS